MKIEEDGTVVFKSKTYFFKLERDGLKPNTVRLLTYDEWQELGGGVDVNEIRIECVRANVSDACFDPFTRTLTSIEQIGELCGYYLFVFSWRHPFFVDEVIALKGAINEIVSNPETKRRIYNRVSELMECKV